MTEETRLAATKTAAGMDRNVAGLLCYLAGWVLMPFLGIAQLILWILLMVKAYNGEQFKLPVIGELAEKNI